MKISSRGLALIKQFEGFSATPYLCPAGKWTIGYGHVIQEAVGSIRHSAISEAEATELLRQDVSIAEEAVNQLVTITLNQNQFDALVSLVFNIGVGAFEKSTLLKLLNRHCERSEAIQNIPKNGLPRRPEGPLAMTAAEFGRWVFAGGKKLPGLVARRKAEAELFFT